MQAIEQSIAFLCSGLSGSVASIPERKKRKLEPCRQHCLHDAPPVSSAEWESGHVSCLYNDKHAKDRGNRITTEKISSWVLRRNL